MSILSQEVWKRIFWVATISLSDEDVVSSVHFTGEVEGEVDMERLEEASIASL